ncbi:MAG TPA: hypothetical protein VFZ21_12565 [Gemmatimonadaceae bacterium]|jgi:hypothetical protein|nr:hypothetical protein [Gemmatimonadaceae bacterium]
MTRVAPWIALLAIGASAGCSRRVMTPSSSPEQDAPAITDGRSLLGVMRARYDGGYYRTLSLTQNNTQYAGRGERKSQWRRRVSLPGKLRIDYYPLRDRSGVLFDGSRIHTFDNGRALDTQPGINAFLLLTADVYVLPAERSAHLVDSLGFDLTTLRRDTWEEHPVYVVGAAAGDSTTSQFWVDADSLIVRRVVQNERVGARDIVTDVRFTKFTTIGGFTMATEVHRYRDGRLLFKEEYVDVRVDEPIGDEVFEAGKW